MLLEEDLGAFEGDPGIDENNEVVNNSAIGQAVEEQTSSKHKEKWKQYCEEKKSLVSNEWTVKVAPPKSEKVVDIGGRVQEKPKKA